MRRTDRNWNYTVSLDLVRASSSPFEIHSRTRPNLHRSIAPSLPSLPLVERASKIMCERLVKAYSASCELVANSVNRWFGDKETTIRPSCRSAIFFADNRIADRPLRSRLIYVRTLFFSSCTRLLAKSVSTRIRGGGGGGKRKEGDKEGTDRRARHGAVAARENEGKHSQWKIVRKSP